MNQIPDPPVISSSRVVISVPPPPLGPSHRRAIVAAVVLTPMLSFLGLELGGVTAMSGAQSQAADLSGRGRYDEAVAVYRAVEQRGGVMLLLARGPIDAAPQDAGRTVLDWAAALDRQGRAADALALLENSATLSDVVLPQPDAQREHAQIALNSAMAEAKAGHWDVALHRLDQLRDGNPPAGLAAQGEALRPSYALQAARLLLDQGRAAEAVTALDDVVHQAGSTPQAGEAQGLLPRALLTAGQQAIDSHDQAQALGLLQRLLSDFPTTSQARQARALLRAPQSVTGTVVRGSTPVAHLQVRLGSNFHQVGNAYQTSGPYYYAGTDSRGDFTIDAVPVGGPYVVELLEQGSWTTTVGPDGPAYQFSVQPLTPVDLAFVVLPS
jgi:tetratricopeptide (TPR) repeat protein